MLNSLRDVLNESIQDLYSAETQLLKALPRMAKAASEPQLKEAFTAHLEQTRNQATRLEKACEHLGIKAKGKTCAAMKGHSPPHYFSPFMPILLRAAIRPGNPPPMVTLVWWLTHAASA